MKTILICHDGADLHTVGLARWLASFSDLVGLVVLREKKKRVWRRIRREVKRVGIVRFLFQVMTFRLYYYIFLAKRDRIWKKEKLEELKKIFAAIPNNVPILYTYSPNSLASKKFIKQQSPDTMIAICKTLLKESVFSIPSTGTFTMHAGICPEYRNSFGCFWALANDDLENVGMTLLKLDKGVDTGPTYGYFRYDYDEVHESHYVIQHRVIFDNLEAVQNKLLDIHSGQAIPVEVSGRNSAEWGQPWLTRYFKWKLKARKRMRDQSITRA
jgi:hypothetical protein